MDILFEQRMQMLLKDEYQNFKAALLKKPIKAFYPVSYTHLDVYKRQT